jgi:hypothetical protein
MKLPADLQKYMTSKEYDQGALIASRRDSIMNILLPATEFLKERPDAQSKAVMDAFKKNVDLYKDTAERVTGVCQCLAIKWLKYKMKERQLGLKGSSKVLPDSRVDKLRLEKTLDKAVGRQTEAGKQPIYTMAFEAAMQLYNVTAQYGWDKQRTLKDLCSIVKGKTHGFFVAGIKTPKYDGNHAVAIYTSGGQLGAKKHAYVFDPNYGEMAFPLSDFGRLFPHLVQTCYQTPEDGVKIFAELNAKG